MTLPEFDVGVGRADGHGNARYGDPTSPQWWNGHDLALVVIAEG